MLRKWHWDFCTNGTGAYGFYITSGSVGINCDSIIAASIGVHAVYLDNGPFTNSGNISDGDGALQAINGSRVKIVGGNFDVNNNFYGDTSSTFEADILACSTEKVMLQGFASLTKKRCW